MAAKKRQIEIGFPLGGLNRKGAYRQQPPYTSTDLLNVRAVTGLEGRERGGSRPGLTQFYYDVLGDGWPIRLLTSMTLAMGDGFTAWSDTFSGASLMESWTQASWATAVPIILSTSLASIDYTIAEGEVVADLISIDTSKAYTVEMFLTPWSNAWHGSYRLYLRLDNDNPDIETDGVMVEITQTGSTGSYTGIIRSVVSGVATDYTITPGTIGSIQPGWLSASISGDVVNVYWNNTLIATQTVGTHAGYRVGFGLKCTVDGGLSLANVFRVQYYSTESTIMLRSMLVGSSFCAIYYESTFGRMTEIDTDVSVRSDVLLTSCQSGQELYIADWGDVSANGTDGTVTAAELTATGITDWRFSGIDSADHVVVISNGTGTAIDGTYKISSVNESSITLTTVAGTGNCSYRIERAPKIYDPSAGTVSIYFATAGKGSVPTGCPLICRYLDRIVFAGAEIAPHVWFASRQGDPLDWDYSQTDAQRAILGPSSDAGVPGDPITALIPHSDDYLIIACTNNIWRLQGDPAYGGSLVNVSRIAGIIGPKAWCWGPTGELIFLSLNGIYVLPAGGNAYPVQFSTDTLPKEFININMVNTTVLMEYDTQNNGIHVYLTSESSNDRRHWWIDWNRKTFWPVSLTSDYEPTATCSVQATAIEDSGIAIGGRDGYIRRFTDLAENDCGTAFSSYAIIGPIALNKDSQMGTIVSIDANIAEESGDVTCDIYTSLTFEGTLSEIASDTLVWEGGLNATNYPAARGQACALKLTGESGRRWAVENINAIIKESGTRRIP